MTHLDDETLAQLAQAKKPNDEEVARYARTEVRLMQLGLERFIKQAPELATVGLLEHATRLFALCRIRLQELEGR